MHIKTLAELREADPRSLMFSPYGLGGQMRPEDSADFLQQIVARYELAPAVGDGIRQSFDQLRQVFVRGLFLYDIFTLVTDRALLVFEQALRERFLNFHGGTITFADRETGQEHVLSVDRYEQVSEFVSHNRRLRLRVRGGTALIPFNGMLAGLRDWARHEGLLRGQRNRAVEQAISRLRVNAAHPSGFHLTTPIDAASTLGDLAEIINHLWGSTTPGGRLYPAPVQRAVMQLSWNTESGAIQSWPVSRGMNVPGQSREAVASPDTAVETGPGGPEYSWQHILVRGVPDDWDLLHFDARYDTGQYPAQWLWGPGSVERAAAWLDRERPEGDEVDTLDRILLLRYHDRLLYLPRNPDQAASVGDDEKPGTWYLVKADSPNQAFNHQRQALAGGFGCTTRDYCPRCPVQTIGHGSWPQVMELLTGIGVSPRTIDVPDVRVPPEMGWPRCNRIIGNGTWDLPE